MPQRCENVKNDIVTILSQCWCASWEYTPDKAQSKGYHERAVVAPFPLWSIQKQDGLVKRRGNNMKDIIDIFITYWRFHLK